MDSWSPVSTPPGLPSGDGYLLVYMIYAAWRTSTTTTKNKTRLTFSFSLRRGTKNNDSTLQNIGLNLQRKIPRGPNRYLEAAIYEIRLGVAFSKQYVHKLGQAHSPQWQDAQLQRASVAASNTLLKETC